MSSDNFLAAIAIITIVVWVVSGVALALNMIPDKKPKTEYFMINSLDGRRHTIEIVETDTYKTANYYIDGELQWNKYNYKSKVE